MLLETIRQKTRFVECTETCTQRQTTASKYRWSRQTTNAGNASSCSEGADLETAQQCSHNPCAHLSSLPQPRRAGSADTLRLTSAGPWARAHAALGRP
eukprot:15521643-Heterocapsa_arctica.AAC.1